MILETIHAHFNHFNFFRVVTHAGDNTISYTRHAFTIVQITRNTLATLQTRKEKG
jgi:hypothetical protein